jgi:uncharacterized surface protein with fasciclin (FAS1) repeats
MVKLPSAPSVMCAVPEVLIQGQLAPDQLVGSHKTLQGDTLQVIGSGQDFTVNGNSSVVWGNIKTANATVYLIDQVLLPQS